MLHWHCSIAFRYPRSDTRLAPRHTDPHTLDHMRVAEYPEFRTVGSTGTGDQSPRVTHAALAIGVVAFRQDLLLLRLTRMPGRLAVQAMED